MKDFSLSNIEIKNGDVSFDYEPGDGSFIRLHGLITLESNSSDLEADGYINVESIIDDQGEPFELNLRALNALCEKLENRSGLMSDLIIDRIASIIDHVYERMRENE